MYSMVLLAAMTTGTDLPDWGRRWGCCGCYGGYGWGGGYGGYGGWGRGYGGGWGGGYGGWGGGYGMGGYGMGGWGGWGGYVYAPYFTGSYVAPVLASNMMPTTTPTLPTVGTRSMYYNPGVTTNNRASIIVHLPEMAILTVNGKATASATATRRFYTPPLDAGLTYDYTFEARMDRYGKVLKVDKHVRVSAGDQKEITITLPDLNPSDPPEAPALPDDKDKKDLRDRTPPVPDRG